VQKARGGEEWKALDTFAEPGRDYTQGKFGFLIQGNGRDRDFRLQVSAQITWRTHSCVPRRQSCRRLAHGSKTHREESRRRARSSVHDGQNPVSDNISAMASANVYPPSSEFASRAYVQGMTIPGHSIERPRNGPKNSGANWRKKSSSGFRSGLTCLSGIRHSRNGSLAGRPTYLTLPGPASCHPSKEQVAILWEGEPGDQRQISYQELHRLVCRFANVLKGAA